ncbi:MAG: hypothetical protein ACOZQL_13090 [Myxococcota bacterium]
MSSDVAARMTSRTAVPQVNVNVGVRPLALAPAFHERPNDFSLGYSVTVTPAPLMHGPYAELSHVFWQHPTSPKHLWRFRSGVLARLIYETVAERFGAQGLLRAVFETSTLVDSDFTTSSSRSWAVGHAFGELGVGLYVESGILALPSGFGWSVSTGLVFTVPASVGVGFGWAL